MARRWPASLLTLIALTLLLTLTLTLIPNLGGLLLEVDCT